MSKLWILLFAGAMAGATASEASGIPVFFEKFAEKYAGEGSDQQFVAAVKENKCNVCHIPDAKKKIQNHYGQQLAKLLNKRDFSFARLKAEPDEAAREIFAALEKLEAKSAPRGKTYGELIESGQLPASDD